MQFARQDLVENPEEEWKQKFFLTELNLDFNQKTKRKIFADMDVKSFKI